MTENKKRDSREDDSDNQKAGMIGLGLLALGAAKYEHEIKLWFYNHMVMVFLIGAGLVALLALWIMTKMKKKNEAFIKRSQGIEQMKPVHKSPQD